MESKQAGWAEQDPNIWWKIFVRPLKNFWQEAQIKADQISSVGISYQMHGLVLVDRDLNLCENLLFGVIAGPLSMEIRLLEHWVKTIAKSLTQFTRKFYSL